MKIFIDNDIAVYRFKLNDPALATQLLGSKAAVEQLTAFAAMCKPAQGHNLEVAKALTDMQSVDTGEATLFAAAAHFDAALVDTGDKKAIRAIGSLGNQHLVTKALAEKIACLEQTVHYLVGRWTYDVVSKAVLSAPHADSATLGCVKGKGEADATTALHQKIEELRPHCGGTLANAPFGWIA